MNFASGSEEQTEGIGKKLASHLKPGDNIRLYGDLGSGKTSLTRGIVDYFHHDAGNAVKSPTFTMLNIYEGEPTIHHFDFYRIENETDIEELGLDDYWGNGINVVEWPKDFCMALPGRTIDVIISIEREKERKITANIPANE
ncbi:MAG: hypothetical protein IEMM0002_1302 [bacterium]|nr:MAG: hypothetical protein IEMM0002_1302 [bacterium]